MEEKLIRNRSENLNNIESCKSWSLFSVQWETIGICKGGGRHDIMCVFKRSI